MIIPSTKIPGKETPRDRDFSLVRVSYELVAKLLELPAGASIVGIQDEFINNSICIKIKGYGRGSSEQGLDIPELAMVENGWMI